MIFKQEMIDAILSGRKTVTRRPVKYGYKTRPWLPGPPREERVELPCRYEAGGGPNGTYALQGPPEKGSKARAKTIEGYRLRVLDVRTEPLGRLTPDEAVREGFSVPFDFFAYWNKLYAARSLEDLCAQLVHRIEFELVPNPRQEAGR